MSKKDTKKARDILMNKDSAIKAWKYACKQYNFDERIKLYCFIFALPIIVNFFEPFPINKMNLTFSLLIFIYDIYPFMMNFINYYSKLESDKIINQSSDN